MKRIFPVLLLAAALASAAAWAGSGLDKLADPRLEARAVALQKQLRCVVCQGESLDESNAPLAADLRHLIRQMIMNGRTDPEIENYLVVRYGDFVLMKPPLEPETYLLWFGPFVVVMIGGAAAAAAIIRAREIAKAETAG